MSPVEVCSPHTSGVKARPSPDPGLRMPVSPGVNSNPSVPSKAQPAGKPASRPGPVGKSLAP
jgi:hypothetical protein